MDRAGDESTGDGCEAYIEDKLMVASGHPTLYALYLQVLAHWDARSRETSLRTFLDVRQHSQREGELGLGEDDLREPKKTPAYVVVSQLAVLGICT
jgi:hypothetical protein